MALGGPVVVTCEVNSAGRAAIEQTIGDAARVVFLREADRAERAALLQSADIVMARNTEKDLDAQERGLLGGARLIQFVTAGVDYIPLGNLPGHVPIASNGGGYSEPMAEHALAMLLASAKRLIEEHDKLKRGEFDQFKPTRMMGGMTAGIVGFGGIGIATARLFRAAGLRIHAMNRSGQTDQPVDWIGPVEKLDELLAASDVLILSLPLTRASERLIDARALSLMKKDAILINLARGEIVDEKALYDHLVATPAFTACIDAWWIEPVRHGAFRMDYPFMDLPNVIGSPHNSASVKGWGPTAMQRAAANVRRLLDGSTPLHVVGPEDRYM